MIQKKDFIEIEYTAKTKDDDIIFDTTSKEVAEKEQILSENARYGPVVICVGERHVLPGLDDHLLGKEPGKSYTIGLTAEEGFGKKNAKLVQLVPTNKFRENKINPVQGLQINMDGMTGIVKTVSGGRTLVDFNHPLSGKALEYEIQIIRKVEDNKEKLKGALQMMGILSDPTIESGKATIHFDMPAEAKDLIAKRIQEMIPALSSVEFVSEKEEASPKK